MRFRNILSALVATFAIFAVLGTGPAHAVCRNLSFTVNHYGKEGPTRDAKALLDKYIVSWTTERGIKRFKKSKKTVSCYKFLDFGFFDEWTCKATSKVCFRGKVPSIKSQTAKKTKAKKAVKKKVAKITKKKSKKKTAKVKKKSPKKKIAKVAKKSKSIKSKSIKTAAKKTGPTKSELAKAKSELAKAQADLRRAEAALQKAESSGL